MTTNQNTILLPEMKEIWQETLNWQPDKTQQQIFQSIYDEILAVNPHLNLTRITEPNEFWEKHLWDSLRGVASLLPSVNSPPKIIDIGTGGGFPGLPVAVIFPQTSVSLLDSTRKKITFIDQLIAKLGINNVETIMGRSEEIARQKQHRQNYDIALIRAVGSASVCAEYALPFLKIGGLAILYRGNWTDKEMEELKPGVKQLGGEIESVEQFTTPLSNSIRHCLYLRLISPTPAKFPRGVGVPAQHPL
ncbi:MAG TPA: 16S rRNA (guanine(527)-N(7))-methyltransferase RsmG [Cyanobacteria bacterium UBA11149]|nr:16S rRNA (guanine(527)-N(7))-methyltransferase RsmG [Cyanobacteria bacterium UBA11367]HBE58472.1 16S rRNA (guanine(527)-N(7))-methyltransferase RsmG [Cyanobacteria bacterium UBA11366]HBK64858.1 16S rRNA (guanine(527)-N(7))-methyltransferase RsmG [Cyanobacteria bacterium UBA11166]HBR74918.1 16S rRNA (guanine(527)-N(7))-methyltransferase RsmG [Cyanobacteria bacterium UBA11159]HBS67716.1 16S rRNA (guanine(527)-N(7))-methyltransferase RsmG [Cyanobacteria bacterium UBA11153]HBW88626.1 16S rRNA (